jgi:hypothetical protein
MVIERWASEQEEQAFIIRKAFLNVVTTPVFGKGSAFERRGEDVRSFLLEDKRRVKPWGLVERAKRKAAFRFWDYLREGGKPLISYCAYHRCGRPFLIGRKKRFCGPKCTRAFSAAVSHKQESIARYQVLFPEILREVRRWVEMPALRRQKKGWKQYLVNKIADLKPNVLTQLEKDAQIQDRNEAARRVRTRLASGSFQPLPERSERIVRELIVALMRAAELQKEIGG